MSCTIFRGRATHDSPELTDQISIIIYAQIDCDITHGFVAVMQQTGKELHPATGYITVDGLADDPLEPYLEQPARQWQLAEDIRHAEWHVKIIVYVFK